jgi:hypothetical protein
VRFRQKAVFFFRSTLDFYRRVKARDRIEPWQGVQGRAFTPALILFIALPEGENKTDPG